MGLGFKFETVDIGKKVETATLNTALENAASEVGLRLAVKPRFQLGYALGSVRETKELEGWDYLLRGTVIPAFKIAVTAQNEHDRFYVTRGMSFGIAKDETVKQYLDAVSRHLSD